MRRRLRTTDDCQTFSPHNEGLISNFLADPVAEIGHDPHLMALCPAQSDSVWQQNHCGIWRSEDAGHSWIEVSEDDGPARFGFAVAVHEKRPEVAYVVPAISEEERTTIGGALCVCRTEDNGASWQQLRRGLPQELCYDLVYRHALDLRGDCLAFGTTTGNLFFSSDGGEGWQTLGTFFPPIYSVRFAEAE